jgi:hypothetical protein
LTENKSYEYRVAELGSSTGPGFAFVSYDQILICGIDYVRLGHNTYILYCVDGSLTQKADMLTFRSCHAVQAYKSFVYVFGGAGRNSVALRESERYDPSVDTWTPTPDLPKPCFENCAILLKSQIFITGR